MKNKGLDADFVHYGIRKEDLRLIETVCQKHELNYDWLLEHILKIWHEQSIKEAEITDRALEQMIERALTKIN